MTIQTDTKGWRIHTLHTNNDATIRDWLTDTGSLTRRLQALGTFSVVVLSQQLALPTRDEAALLGLTIMVAGTTPEDERDFGVEGNG